MKVSGASRIPPTYRATIGTRWDRHFLEMFLTLKISRVFLCRKVKLSV